MVRLARGTIGRRFPAAFPATAPTIPPATAPTGPATLPIAAPATAVAVCFGMDGIFTFSEDWEGSLFLGSNQLQVRS
jgi:hypothetical protein